VVSDLILLCLAIIYFYYFLVLAEGCFPSSLAFYLYYLPIYGNGYLLLLLLLLLFTKWKQNVDLYIIYSTHVFLSFSLSLPPQLLIKRKADVNGANFKGETPLHQATRVGNEEAIGMLIESGANVNLQNKYEGSTYPVNRRRRRRSLGF